MKRAEIEIVLKHISVIFYFNVSRLDIGESGDKMQEKAVYHICAVSEQIFIFCGVLYDIFVPGPKQATYEN